MSDLFQISSNPHVRDQGSTSQIMRDVIIALLPATAFGIFNFGTKALILILATVASCVVTEALYQFGMHKTITINDYSAALTGLLLALNLSADLPVWMAMLGGVFAILIVKQLFGGLGQNFMNPALAARAFLLISFAGPMTNFSLDGVSGATPLAALKNGQTVNLMDSFIGTIGGTIGETSVIALLIGAMYLLLKRIIDFRIPLTYIGTLALFVLIFGNHGFDLQYLGGEIFGGGLILGAFYMATDYVTSPITPRGKIIFGILIGIFTGIFRLFGGSAEGVCYAIIFGNLLVPLIEKWTVPKAFGKGTR